MKKYLVMGGYFIGNVTINADGQICDDKYFRGSTDIAEDYYEPICHAINSHDELVEMNKELLAALEAAVECGMVPTSSAAEGGAMKYVRQAHVADQIRAAISKANVDKQSQPNALRDDVYVAGGK